MKNINPKEIFTEEEAIKITVEYGIGKGEEFETKRWKEYGCLKPGGTLNALVNKLEAIYENVKIEGKGKKRRYIFTNKKDAVTERETNYKGRVPTNEDQIMKEYIFIRILSLREGTDFTYSTWAKHLGFYNTSLWSTAEMIEKIKDLHYGNNVIYNPKEIVSKFIATLKMRNKDVIDKSFKRLEKEERINVSTSYYLKKVNGVVEEVHQWEYEVMHSSLKEFVESQGVSFYAYSQAIYNFHKTEKMKEVIREIKRFLALNYDVKNYFKSYKVTVLDRKVKQGVSDVAFEKAYVQRLIKLTKDRQEKDSYKNSISYWKKFYLLNTLTFLIHIGVDGINELFKEVVKFKEEEQEKYALDYLLNAFNKDVEGESNRHSF